MYISCNCLGPFWGQNLIKTLRNRTNSTEFWCAPARHQNSVVVTMRSKFKGDAGFWFTVAVVNSVIAMAREKKWVMHS